MELVQAKSYIHSTLSIEYKRQGDEPSKPQLAFRRLQIELAEREEALRVATAEVGTLQALLETKRWALLLIPQWRESLSVFNILMTKLERSLETWASMQPDYFALMLKMTRFSELVLGDCARPYLIAWAMFDLLSFFSIYFVSAHELYS